MRWRAFGTVLALVVGAAGLQACGNPAAVPDTRAEAERDDARSDRGERRYASAERRERRAERRARDEQGPAPRWAANRSRSGEQQAQRAFTRNGRDFGDRDVDAYVARAVAFTSSPPEGTLTLTRANGDRLFYDPRENVFAVADRRGSVRTMFKPEERMAYWREQEQRQASGGRARASRDREQARASDAQAENG